MVHALGSGEDLAGSAVQPQPWSTRGFGCDPRLDWPQSARSRAIDAPTLGMTLYWVNFNAATINGWWWRTAPTVIILMVFLGLFFLTVGLDEIANPRLRRSA